MNALFSASNLKSTEQDARDVARLARHPGGGITVQLEHLLQGHEVQSHAYSCRLQMCA